MSSQNQFTYTKATLGNNMTRSKWKMPHRWQGSIYHGDLVPLEITEVLAGDSFRYRLKNLTRTATAPIFPIMDNITEHFGAWFIPKRLVWSLTKKFYGENTDGYGIQSEILEPRQSVTCPLVNNALSNYPRSLGTYLGIIRQNTTGTLKNHINVNPLRAYLLVYNYFFRNQNFMDPYTWNMSQSGDNSDYLAYVGNNGINFTSNVPVVCKKSDVFTTALPWTQKLASPVTLPLGVEAPVKWKTGANIAANTIDALSIENATSSVLKSASTFSVSDSGLDINASLMADLRNATAASINQLRMAVALQRYYESLARCGSFYQQYIKQFFDVDTGDVTAQIPEYLGGIKRNLNIASIYQTTNYAAGSTTKLGAPGAVSVTTGDDILFDKSFTEPGYLVICYWTKHDRSYGQGISDMWKKHELLEHYNPKFAHIGETPIPKTRIYLNGTSDDDNEFFGFQEAWNEYRYINDKVIGTLNPSLIGSYNFVNLADNFVTSPTLGADFLKEDRNAIIRCLAGGESSPDYFLDVFFDADVIRPMPVHSVPGLMDHF